MIHVEDMMSLIHRMFAKSEDADGQASIDPAASAASVTRSAHLRVGRASDVGQVRSHNEDVLMFAHLAESNYFKG